MLFSLLCLGLELCAQTSSSPPVYKTSFDCSKAKETSVEQLVCANALLAQLDLEMASAYKKRLASAASSQRYQLVSSQKEWLAIRNSYSANPYQADLDGTLSDIADFYRNRIKSLRSGSIARLNVKPPREYAWFESIAPQGFPKEFFIGRDHMSCQNPCEEKSALYKVLAVVGNGVGEPPGDIEKPYTKLVGRLGSEGWTKCRSTSDDSGKLRVEYFRKQQKMVSLSTYSSMGTGNSISISMTISDPVAAEAAHKKPPNPTVDVTADWITYSSPEFGMEFRYPPGWWIRDDSVPNSGSRSVTLGARDYTGNFSIRVFPKTTINPNWINRDSNTGQECPLSSYRISGFPSHACLFEGEDAGVGTCTRYLISISAETDKYYLTFSPGAGGSFADESRQYRLTDLYEKILSTIKVH